MKFMHEFRDRRIAGDIAGRIKALAKRKVTLMEVCGGHTMAIHRFGIPSLLPDTLTLLSGPGCPVCVTGKRFLDHAVALARRDDVVIATFGDLIRVPGSTSSLEKEKAAGRDIRIVYSALDAVKMAGELPSKKVVFLGIGFETTAPTSAAAVFRAEEDGVPNFFLLSSHKIMPPAMEALINSDVKIDGYIAPGHVSMVTGTGIFRAIPEKFRLGVVVSGFEPLDLLQSIYMLVRQIEDQDPKVEIQYTRAVQESGNTRAIGLMGDVFAHRDDTWRGLGVLPGSGLGLSEKYARFDAEKEIPVEIEETAEERNCICGNILKGLNEPKDCPLFGKACTPVNPAGACMVSSEGSCQAYYRYH
jgi:hydrogenase expression/formation protein HypD